MVVKTANLRVQIASFTVSVITDSSECLSALLIIAVYYYAVPYCEAFY